MTQPEIVKVNFDDMAEAAAFAKETRKRLNDLAAEVMKSLNMPWQGLAGNAFDDEKTKFLAAWLKIENALDGLADLIGDQIASDLLGTDGSQAGVLDGAGTVRAGMGASSFSYVSSGLNNS